MNIELTKAEARITVEALRLARDFLSPCNARGEPIKAKKLSDLAKRIARKSG